MDTWRKGDIFEENRTFTATLADSYAFTPDDTGLPVYLICGGEIGKQQSPQMLKGIFGISTQPLLKINRMEMRD